MNFLELAQSRYSVRQYQPHAVEEAKLQKILEAGRIAPTGANRQPQRLLVIQSAAGLEKLKLAANVYGAPLAIIVCADHESVWKRSHDGKDISDIDASIVTDHMMLAATELGLGSLWVCSFKSAVIRTEFNLPGNIEPINILAIGYAGPDSVPNERHTDRKPLAETVFYEGF